MSTREKVPFGDLLLDSKDGEWGEGAAGVGLIASDMIRGTDFADLNSPSKILPRRYVNEKHATRKRLQVGDIVFEMAGGTAKQSTGRSALITKAFLEKHGDTTVLCASFCRHLRLDQSKHDPQYVYFVLQALYGAGYMGVFNIQHTGVSRFQYTSFKKHTVLEMPKLGTQQKIAAVLSAYDDLIANNQRRITLLERMAEDIYREWFVRLRFPGHENAMFEKGVPQGWSVYKFRDVVQFYIGGGWGEEVQTATHSEPAYVIRGTDIPGLNNGDAQISSLRFHTPSNLKSRLMQKGDLVFEVSGGSKDQLLGRNLLVSERLLRAHDDRVICASFCKMLRFDTALVSPYTMKYFFKLYYETDLVGLYQVQSTGISNYQFEAFLNYQTILLPPLDLQAKFDAMVEPILELKDDIALQTVVLRQTRDALLPRLISGKLSVDALDICFPPGMVEVG